MNPKIVIFELNTRQGSALLSEKSIHNTPANWLANLNSRRSLLAGALLLVGGQNEPG